MSVVAALGVAAAIFALLAFITPGLWSFTRGWSPPMEYFRRLVLLAEFWL
jgi:hypothetical protein